MDTAHLADLGSRLLDVAFHGKSDVPVLPGLDAAAAWVQSVLAHPSCPDLPRVDQTDLLFARAVLLIALPPLLWNLLGRLEFHTRLISTLAIKPIIGVYLCAALIASLSLYRSALVLGVIRAQPRWSDMDQPLVHALGGLLFAWGLVVLVGAWCRLGVTGTYLGDYFGILKQERITAFPFSMMDHPMYDGIAMLHLSEALLENSPAGVVLAAFMFFCYRLGCIFEEPFTAMIYRRHAEKASRAFREEKSKSS